jgi:hypothetical protein
VGALIVTLTMRASVAEPVTSAPAAAHRAFAPSSDCFTSPKGANSVVMSPVLTLTCPRKFVMAAEFDRSATVQARMRPYVIVMGDARFR